MLKIILFCCVFARLSKNEQIYDDENLLEYKEKFKRNTEEYYDSLGRRNLMTEETRPVFPINTYLGSGPPSSLQESTYYTRPIRRPSFKKNNKPVAKRKYKYLIPLLINALLKVANFLPVLKLTLLALFALVLFSKKALLVSIGSLILVAYDTFYKKFNKVKDRGSNRPSIAQDSLPEEPSNLEEWWSRDKIRPLQFESDSIGDEKWKKRWKLK